MKLTCLIFLAVLSVVVVTECKSLSDEVNEVEKTPCVDCEQKHLRQKRFFPWFPFWVHYNVYGQSSSQVMTSQTYKVNIGNGHHNTNNVNYG